MTPSSIILPPFILLMATSSGEGILYPRASETREVVTLDGLWNFVLLEGANKMAGHYKHWYKTDLDKLEDAKSILMPVPSSYNDITTDVNVRDHVGVVWYDRRFYVPESWSDQLVWLRFSSVLYAAEVWINGEIAMTHQIGHLPFQANITSLLVFGAENRVTVACDNTLLNTTIPQGQVNEVETDNGKKLSQSYTFDFFNYAGIHRSVTLYTTPKHYIEDITVQTLLNNTTGFVRYEISVSNESDNIFYAGVKLYDQNGIFVSSQPSKAGTLLIREAKLWWPYLMHEDPGYLYNLEIHLLDVYDNIVDVYRLKIGIRTLRWTNSSFLINNQPVYMHGFGRHEDSDIRGRGFDLATSLRDYNLIKWVGGNAYRTSHYPYADEIMDLADKFGIMIIDECPAVNIDNVSERLQKNHIQALKELIQRDKNRPSVVAWSIANEPRSGNEAAGRYFKVIANRTKDMDRTRPITASLNVDYDKDYLAQYLDIVSFNRYNGWYRNEGQLDMIIKNVITEAENWRGKFKKPVLMSEYGADTMEGLHSYPEFIWSEEYQVALLSKHFEAFDQLRKEGWFIGEFIWNFADFKTSQKITRVGGNKKGIFTRNRQPKNAAHLLRRRYFSLSKELYNATLPNDLVPYIASKKTHRDEL